MRLDLNMDWKVRSEELDCDIYCANLVLNKEEDWLITNIPCDIREPLIRQGIIEEPLEGMNCFDSEWIENKSWWFKKTFYISEELLEDDIIELVLESLDYGADIFINGYWIGYQLSSFYAFRKDVKKFLCVDENDLLIRLTTGIERVNPEDMMGYIMNSEEKRRPGRGDKRKAFMRKPQYSFGWDWNPRVATCGIMKDVWIESHQKAVIRWVHTSVKRLKPETCLSFTVEVENFHSFSTLSADLQISLDLNGEIITTHESNVLLRSGITTFDIETLVPYAKLWWPNGMGEQPLYNIKISMNVNGRQIEYPMFSYGIRMVSLDTSKLENDERKFSFLINGVAIFCKGANWIPADSLYGRVTKARYETLVEEAKQANFNMLRIWGGGLYERDIFYELCDKNGILIWHDFMFACSEYPDDQSWFLDEVEKELDYQTRKLCNHSSLVLWCGNNENHWAFDEWWNKETDCFGSKIYNYLAPNAVRRNCPEIPYWNSSPYGGQHPNEFSMGDCHHWHACMMNDEMQKRITPEEYDKVTAKFVSEYGYVGPLKKSSIIKYHKEAQLNINSEIWQHHNNTFEKDTVIAGIKNHYTDLENLSIDNYLLFAGLCQGLIYSYSLEAFRYKMECSGGLFWMYNDCWGETGWTIIDYYLTRKISYYFVKRAFEPVKFILREELGMIHTVGINETPESMMLNIEYGYVSYDGEKRDTKTITLELPAHSRYLILSFDKGLHDEKKGLYFIRESAIQKIPVSILRTSTYREQLCPQAIITIESIERSEEGIRLAVKSDCYAHSVHFNLPDEIKLSDEYFDLLPGETRNVMIYDIMEVLELSNIKATAVNV